MKQNPFVHGNLQMAIALAMAECPPYDICRVYSPKECRHLGLPALELAKRGQGGRFEFYHERSPQLTRAIEAFDARKAEIAVAQEGKKREAPDITGGTPELAAQYAVDYLVCHRIIMDDLRNPENAWIQEMSGEPQFKPDAPIPLVSGESKSVSGTISGGFRRARATASRETLQRLNLL